MYIPPAFARTLCLALLAGTTCVQPALADADPISLPFKQEFSGERIPAGWAVDNSDRVTVTPKDGQIAVDAPADKRALIAHRAGVDNITITARIVDAATVYLVWDGLTIAHAEFSPHKTLEVEGDTIRLKSAEESLELKVDFAN